MTVHGFRIHTHTPGGMTFEDIRLSFEKWRTDHPEVLTGEASITLAGDDADAASPSEHIYAEIRFDTTTSRSQLEGAITGVLEQAVDWYAIGYHGCDHDISPDQRGSCTYTYTKWGPVPSGVGV